MIPLPLPFPGGPGGPLPIPPLDFSAGPSNAQSSQSTPINVGGLSTGGDTDTLLWIALAVAAVLILR